MRKDQDTTTPAAKIGAVVRALRRERGWRLKDLSEKTDLSISSLSQLESGKTRWIHADSLSRIALAFQVKESVIDPSRCAERIKAESTFEQRRIVDTVLSLPPDAAAEAAEIVELIRKRHKTK